MQEKLYIMSGSGIQEVDVLQQDNEEYTVVYCGNSMVINKKTMTGWMTGDRKWMKDKPSKKSQMLVDALQAMLEMAITNNSSSPEENSVVYDRLKQAGLV